MRQTLFHIKHQIGSVELFGFSGLLFILWLVISAIVLWRVSRKHGWTAETFNYLPILGIVAVVIGLVLPAVCDDQGLPIRGYGFMLLIAIVSGVGLAIWRGRHRGLDADTIISLCFWAILPGIFGARLFHVIEYWEFVKRDTLVATVGSIINIAGGGLVVYGGIIGGTLGIIVFLRRKKLPVLPTFDVLAPCLMLGMGFGRIGCLLNGCCFGHPCDLPWAITFPTESYAHMDQLEKGEAYLHGMKLTQGPAGQVVIDMVQPGSEAERHGITSGQVITSINQMPIENIVDPKMALFHAHESGHELAIGVEGRVTPYLLHIEHAPLPLPVHPTQIYSALNGFLLCGLLLLAERFWLRRDGQVFALLITLYPVSRFILEIIRTDEGSQFGTGLTISQLISIGILILAVGIWTYTVRQPVSRDEKPVH